MRVEIPPSSQSFGLSFSPSRHCCRHRICLPSPRPPPFLPSFPYSFLCLCACPQLTPSFSLSTHLPVPRVGSLVPLTPRAGAELLAQSPTLLSASSPSVAPLPPSPLPPRPSSPPSPKPAVSNHDAPAVAGRAGQRPPSEGVTEASEAAAPASAAAAAVAEGGRGGRDDETVELLEDERTEELSSSSSDVDVVDTVAASARSLSFSSSLLISFLALACAASRVLGTSIFLPCPSPYLSPAFFPRAYLPPSCFPPAPLLAVVLGEPRGERSAGLVSE